MAKKNFLSCTIVQIKIFRFSTCIQFSQIRQYIQTHNDGNYIPYCASYKILVNCEFMLKCLVHMQPIELKLS